MRYLLLIVISITLLSGCSFGEDPDRKEKLIEGMEPTIKGHFSVYAYYEHLPPKSPEQVKVYDSMKVIESFETVETLSVSNGSFDIFNIEKFPTFIVVDKTGIVLQTTELDKVVAFIKKTNPNRTD